jgi:hypothetical protein
VAKVVTCLISQGYFRKSNDVEVKCLHQLQTNSKDNAQNASFRSAKFIEVEQFSLHYALAWLWNAQLHTGTS